MLPFMRWLGLLCASSLLLASPIVAQTTSASDVWQGIPRAGDIGVSVSTAELMARQQEADARTRGQPRAPRIRPVLRPDRSGLPQNPDSPASPAG